MLGHPKSRDFWTLKEKYNGKEKSKLELELTWTYVYDNIDSEHNIPSKEEILLTNFK